jgi:hypothetical protein
LLTGESVFFFAIRFLIVAQVNDTDDMWATKFKSHSEEIRHGPTSLMWDASFPGAAAVYGIPEHATSMALRPTMVRVRPR